jgi:hypothetical protein
LLAYHEVDPSADLWLEARTFSVDFVDPDLQEWRVVATRFVGSEDPE